MDTQLTTNSENSASTQQVATINQPTSISLEIFSKYVELIASIVVGFSAILIVSGFLIVNLRVSQNGVLS